MKEFDDATKRGRVDERIQSVHDGGCMLEEQLEVGGMGWRP
jgi:hypothetical protein